MEVTIIGSSGECNPLGMFQENVLLKNYSHYKIGGPARYFCIVRSVDELKRAIAEAGKFNAPLFILGGGTNIVFPDGVLDAAVIKIDISGMVREGNAVRAGAGAMMADMLSFVADASLSGLEWAGGLPGTVGGAVRGNAGAFGGETKDSIKEVTSVDAVSGALRTRGNAECAFDYRTSVFKEENSDTVKEIIVEAVFQLASGEQKVIRQAMEDKIAYRRARHPVEYPNVGSIFKNIDIKQYPHLNTKEYAHVIKADPFPVMPVAYLIAQTDLKGKRHGGAMISEKHPNFIVNTGDATAKDVRALADLMKTTIKEKFNVELEEEVLFL